MKGQYPLSYQQFHQIIFIKGFQVQLLSYKQTDTQSRAGGSVEVEQRWVWNAGLEVNIAHPQ